MWVSRAVWEEALVARAKAEAQGQELVRQNAALSTSLEWQLMRLNQLEHERAKLIETYMGVKIQVAEVTKEPQDTSEILQTVPDFADIGDEEAARLGIAWNDIGEVVHAGKQVKA